MVAKKRTASGWASSASGLDDETHEFYKSILQSNRIRVEQRRELEALVKLMAQERSVVAQAREVAARQARRVYKCEGCSLEFLGILAYAEHDEETSHMTRRGKKVQINGHL